jgi:TatD DNase family protein
VEDLDTVLKRARERGVIAIIAVGSDYESNNQILEIAEKYKPYIYPALGFHPWSLGANASGINRNLQFIEENMEDIIAIGEIGLDYHKGLIKEFGKDFQKKVFKSVLELAQRYRKPAIIHSRYAWRDGFNLVRDVQVEKAIFHWYTGPLNVLRDILNQGYFVSATLAVRYHEEHRRAIKEAKLENLLLETDAPVIYREGTELEHKSEPADVPRVLDAVAKLKGIEPSIVADKTTENALRFYEIAL